MTDSPAPVVIGKFRRPAHPGALLMLLHDGTFTLGDGEGMRGLRPCEVASWLRAKRGWLRVYSAAKRSTDPAIVEFLRAWRRGGTK
jgi:hypothetical protein